MNFQEKTFTLIGPKFTNLVATGSNGNKQPSTNEWVEAIKKNSPELDYTQIHISTTAKITKTTKKEKQKQFLGHSRPYPLGSDENSEPKGMQLLCNSRILPTF